MVIFKEFFETFAHQAKNKSLISDIKGSRILSHKFVIFEQNFYHFGKK